MVTITGTAKKPDGTLFASATFKFTRTPYEVVSQNGSVIAPSVITATSNGSGAVSFSLLPGNYTGFEQSTRVTFDFVVPDEASADWADCVGGATGPDVDEFPASQVSMSGGGTAQDYAGFSTRAAFVTWAADVTPATGAVIDAAGFSYRYTGSGTAISDLPGWVPNGDAYPDHWQVNTTPGTTDMGAAFTAARDWAYSMGGGTIWLRKTTYATSATVKAYQNVIFRGEGGGFANQYTNNEARPAGSCIFALAGMNANVCEIVGNYDTSEGYLRDAGTLLPNRDARHCGGFMDLVIWGNRSATATVTANDLNSTGHGIAILGARYGIVQRVYTMFCAQDGIFSGAKDYGLGSQGSNNSLIRDVHSLSNYNHGANLSCADRIVSNMNCGANGGSGFQNTGSGVMTSILAWNNKRRGIYHLNGTENSSSIYVGFYCYDNDEAGFEVGSGRAPMMKGVSSGNGRGGATNRHNYLISSGAYGWNLSGCQSDSLDQDTVATVVSQYKINNSVYSGSIDGCTYDDLTTAFDIADQTKIISHGDVSGITHPGFVLQSGHKIDMADNRAINARGLSYNAWATISSVTSGAIACAYDTLINLSTASGTQTVTDLTSSFEGLPVVYFRNANTSDWVFTHNSAKLRCNNNRSFTLKQYEGAIFAKVTDTVWQQVGGKVTADWADLTSKPTTLAGFGITDAAPVAYGVLQSDYTLTSTTSTQKLFNWSSNGALTLATGVYQFETTFYVSSMDTTSGNASFSLKGAGTATLAKVIAHVIGADTTGTNTAATQSGQISITGSSSATMVSGAVNTALGVTVSGTFDVTASGTIIPSIGLAVAAAAIVSTGSSFRCVRIGDTGSATAGTWS